MPYDRRHIHCQWGGTLPGGEIWSNSLRMGGTQTGANSELPTHGELEDWCHGAAKDAVSAFHGDFGAKVSSQAKLTYLKMNVVGLDGRYTDLNTIEHIYSPVVPGSSNANIHPNQVTLCVSLTTDFSRGYAHRGRFYLPMPCHLVDPVSGLISVPDALQVATAAGTFIEALADEPGFDVGPLNMKVLVMSQRATGVTNPVTGVDVGRALDTQRRRRTELPEDYQHVVVSQ